MKHSYLDEYSRNNSLINSLDPRIKIITFAVFIFFIISTSPYSLSAFISYGSILAFVTLLSGIPFLPVLKRVSVVLPFALIAAIFMPFFKSGVRIAEWHIAQIRLPISREGVEMLWNCIIKSVLSAFCLAVLSSTTKFSDLLKGLTDLKTPKIIIVVLSFMYRYIFLAEDHLMKLTQAISARSVNNRPGVTVLSKGLGVFFIHAYERAEMVYISMCARGFTGDIKTFSDFRIKSRDIIFMSAVITLLIIIKLLTKTHG